MHRQDPIKNSSLNAVAAIPKTINLIWIGGPLRPAYIQRAQEWVRLNPNYSIIYYIENKYKDAIKKQLSNPKIILKDITNLPVSANMNNFIRKLIEPRLDGLPPNYAAASDIYRSTLNGVYVDTDIIPFDASTTIKSAPFNFIIHGAHDGDTIIEASPDVFAISPNHVIAKSVQQYFEMMAAMIRDEHIQLIRSSMASIRKVATEYSTGSALKRALGKLTIDGEMCNAAQFDLFSQEFDTEMEQSYISEELEREGVFTIRKPLPGIVFDTDYILMAEGIQPDSTVQAVNSITILGDVIFDKLDAPNFVTRDNTNAGQSEVRSHGLFSSAVSEEKPSQYVKQQASTPIKKS